MSVPFDLSSRVAALENSEELRDIYSHPLWTSLMQLTKSANDDQSKHRLQLWAEAHYQLAPLISWFHSCTHRYGLSFDIYHFVPLSRLLIEERCQERIKHYNNLMQVNKKNAQYYESMLRTIRNGPNSPSLPDRTGATSCWSVLSDCSYQLGLDSDSSCDTNKSLEWMNESVPTSDNDSAFSLDLFTLPPPSFESPAGGRSKLKYF